MPPDPYPRRTDVSTRLELLARAESDPAARQELCDRYAPVVFTRFHARGAAARADALDHTHGFLLHYFLEPTADGVFRFAHYLARPPADRGRFLAYTLLAAKRFRLDDHRRATNAEHGGGWRRVAFDADPARFADFLAAKDLGPDEAVEQAYTLSLLWQAARRVVARLTARPDDPAGQAFHDALAAGREPNLRALAKQTGEPEDTLRKNWAAVRADRALAPYLFAPPPPYAELTGPLAATEEALKTRFSRLRAPVRVEFQRIMADELGSADPVRAAAEAARLLDALARLTGNA